MHQGSLGPLLQRHWPLVRQTKAWGLCRAIWTRAFVSTLHFPVPRLDALDIQDVPFILFPKDHTLDVDLMFHPDFQECI